MTAATQPVLVDPAIKLGLRDARLAALMLEQQNDLPLAESWEITATASHLKIRMLMACNADVEAWAEAMNVDADHHRRDDTWIDEAEGHVTVFTPPTSYGQRAPGEDVVHVEVWSVSVAEEWD